MTDTRLVGMTAESIFLTLLNEKDIFSHTFDTACFDGIVFDINKKYFEIGNSPFYVQIKCRGSKTDKFNPQGHSPKVFEKIRIIAKQLNIPGTSLYFVVGFYKNSDVRNISYYIIPFEALNLFKSKGNKEYRFSVQKCEQIMKKNRNIIKI